MKFIQILPTDKYFLRDVPEEDKEQARHFLELDCFAIAITLISLKNIGNTEDLMWIGKN